MTRALTAADFDAVVALDARIGGGQRRAYFESRLRAALRQPRRHLQVAAAGDGLSGFILARKAGGEYGDPEDTIVLEAFGVDPDRRRRGVGREMLTGLEELARARGIPVLSTQASWRDHGILAFLDKAGFELSPRRILEMPVRRFEAADGDFDRPPPLVRNLREGDLAALSRIDGRAGYVERKVDEALHESAIQVSLVVEEDGFPVGFAMARVDFGDFGHLGATASLDTIGVDARFARKGYASALLVQMIENLAALHVERLETEVPPDAIDLHAFLSRFGFVPSRRLSFRKRI